MFGIRYASLFTSRWMALGWAVLICLSAIQFVGTDGDQDAPAGAQDANADAAAVNTAIAALN